MHTFLAELFKTIRAAISTWGHTVRLCSIGAVGCALYLWITYL